MLYDVSIILILVIKFASISLNGVINYRLVHSLFMLNQMALSLVFKIPEVL